MDLQMLSSLFATTFNPDPNIRKSAELEIRKVGNQNGMITALLQIIATDSIDLPIRQACAVWVKNRVFTHYSNDKKGGISQTDREALRSNLLHLIAAAPSRSIGLQLANVLKLVICRDFPHKWPGLLDEIKRLLASSEIREVHAGCVAALETVRAFRFIQNNEVLPSVIPEIFPTLVNIASHMMQTPPTTSQDIPAMLHLILKTYKTSIVMSLSAHQQSAESIVPWGQLFFSIVNLQIPSAVVPEDEEERERAEWWKTKKWAYAILGRLFHRYGNPSQLPSTMQNYSRFAHHFVTTFAPEILNVYFRQVDLFVSGQAWLSQKCQYQIFTFFSECVKPKSTWALLKPHFETLVSSFVFPQLSFNTTKQNLWENDPVDYVRISVDEYESFATPVSAATTFLFGLATNRTNTTFLPILSFINSVLQSNASATQRFGALNMAAALGPWMMKHPTVKDNMETFIMQYVTPQLSSPEPYLRAITCEVIGTVVKNRLQWTSEEHLHTNFTAVVAAMDDPEFPVRVQACLALTEMVVAYDSVKTAVAPQVSKVIQSLLKLADESDLDILNHSMDVMVDQYQTELLPVAAQLTERLCDSYLRLARETIAQDSEADGMDLESLMSTGEDDKTYYAMGIAKTIWTVINSIESAPEILAQVQEIVIPIVTFTLENKFLDLFDSMYELVDSLTFKLRAISPSMWPVFELTYKQFKSDAVDYLEEMLPSLDNFVSFGSEVIRNRADYKRMLVDIYTTSIVNEHLGENDRVNGCKLAESVLLNLRGSVDDALQPFIITALDQLDKTETPALRLANLEVLINAILYNPTATLHIMETSRPGLTRVFLDKWFAAINSENQLPRVHDKRLSILALSALIEMDPSGIPESVQQGWPGILGGILKLFRDFPKAVEARKALEEALQEDEDEDDVYDEKSLNLNEDDEDVWDEDSAYLEMLAKEGARLRERSAGEEEYDDEEDEDIEEELGYYSPLDNVNPYVSFQQALTAFQMKSGNVYQAATTSLTVEQQTVLMEVMKVADAVSK
ncbi:ARM repeat-containing protein [Guyanagaster necrorhizus]|uniref:ARM repeat-containing protein n=1 Tax=Guyanagaster necrorhizus TaxID=856835 RepID=A0A9P8ARZ8_9AGAR|nr:ARM repeat-containing protein [Guyanagaster necrorhizus MCA 3950]KAG7445610.1 ARM repeat-containing protein [Guyanagaster necrorhizus MCA 3950]